MAPSGHELQLGVGTAGESALAQDGGGGVNDAEWLGTGEKSELLLENWLFDIAALLQVGSLWFSLKLLELKNSSFASNFCINIQLHLSIDVKPC